MRGPKLVGYPPSALRWSGDSKDLYFEWRQPGDAEPSTWVVGRDGGTPRRLTDEERKLAPPPGGVWDRAGRRVLAVQDGDIVLIDTVARTRLMVTRTTGEESSPRWARGDTHVTFVRDNNLFIVPLGDPGGDAARGVAASAEAAGEARGGIVTQLTDIGPKRPEPKPTPSQQFLREEEKQLLEFVREAAARREEREARRKQEALPSFELGDRQRIADAQLSPDGTHVFLLVAERPQGARTAEVPAFVTESAYTEEIAARTKVGDAQERRRLAILNLRTRTSVWADLGDLAAPVPGRPTPDAERPAHVGADPQASPAAAAAPSGPAADRSDGSQHADGGAQVPPPGRRLDQVETRVLPTSTPPEEPGSTRAHASPSQSPTGGSAADTGPDPSETAQTRERPAGGARSTPQAAAPEPAKAAAREVRWSMPIVSADGRHVVGVARAADNKDRWIVAIDPETGACRLVDRVHDDAWVRDLGGGPGGGAAPMGWLEDERTIWFTSEHGGWMHLYTADLATPGGGVRPLTSGPWEVTAVELSRDRRTFYLTTTEVHAGERHVFAMPAAGGPRTRLTWAPGSHAVQVSPDGTRLGLISSAANRPPEVFIAPNQPGASAVQVTTSTTEEWRSFPWVEPRLVTFRARDGVEVPARLYTPEMLGARRDPARPGVVFIHGAGYAQNAHRYWSTYYREYMFHHLLASRGYVVLDVDYRGSAGYGRDWRTAIYGHMGGKDLDDIVDAAGYLVSREHVHPGRLGVYGGSYGGFLTLMALFTSPDTFAAGAALRPVTDWAHYNHTYTSNILDLPQEAPEAYRRSSPIYFADRLKAALLICHGMVDTNVHFQDSVRLVQRLIELRKENWELAVYPVENHGFEQETSWADEYRRILRLFETHLRLRQ
jgi:dipeptidyl aminopeptidase/acylaminoacyl peptidase